METKFATENKCFPLVDYIREALPTCDFLTARRIEITNTCYLCNKSNENNDHIFKICPFIQGIWERIKYNCPTPLFYEDNFLSWLELVHKNYKTHCKIFKQPMEKLLLSFRVFGHIGIMWYLGNQT